MRFPPNPNLDWSSTPKLLDLEMLDYDKPEDFDRLAKAVFAETDKELTKANKTRHSLASDEELVDIVKAAVESYKPGRPATTLLIHAYLRVREFLWRRNRRSEPKGPGPRQFLGKLIPLGLLSLALFGCHESGTWVDDRGNWKRIFRAPQPADVKIIHSWFWRSPHFTYEFEYFLQLDANIELQKELFKLNPLSRSYERELQAFPQPKPDWFAPKPLSDYETWAYADRTNSNFRLLIDRKSGELFLTDWIL